MINKFTILNSELEFRNYIISIYKYITKIIIFEDELDNNIYFYCFTNNEYIATKESNSKNFSYYYEIYNNLNLNNNSNKNKVLELTKRNKV